MLGRPSSRDLIIRRLSGFDPDQYGIFRIGSQTFVEGPFAALRDAWARAQILAAAGGGTIWQQASDDRDRPLGPPQPLVATDATR